MTPISTLSVRTIRTPPSAMSPCLQTRTSAINASPSGVLLRYHIIWYLRIANERSRERDVATRSAAGREPPPRPPKTGIGMLLRDADTAFNRYLRTRLAAHAVTFGQFQHLRNLWVEDGLTQAELSRRIGIEMASSTAILDSLEAQRLVTRMRNAA